MSKVYSLEGIPEDGVKRVVRSYGQIIQNTSDRSNPLVEVAFRKVNQLGKKERLDEGVEYFKIGVSYLTLARIGSIWHGNKHKKGTYWGGDHLKEQDFKFDFSQSSINFLSLSELFPEYPPESKVGKTRVAQLTSVDGQVVYIQSLEILTTINTPMHKKTRQRLLLEDIDSVVDHMIRSPSEKGLRDGQYIVSTRYKKITATFLAYLKNNAISRTRLRTIRNQINSNQTYIDVYPYHPRFLVCSIKGVMKNECFFAHRVSSVVSPTDYPQIEVKEKSIKKAKSKNKKYGNKPKEVHGRKEIHVAHSGAPSQGAQRQYVPSGVKVIDKNLVTTVVIDTDYETINNPNQKDRPENFSSGSEFSENENIGSLMIGDDDENEDSETVKNYIEALNELLDDENSDLQRYEILESANGALCVSEFFWGLDFFSEIGEGEYIKYRRWEHDYFKRPTINNKYAEYTFRRAALIKVDYYYQELYFLEIESLDSSRFKGLLFSAEHLSYDLINKILATIRDSKGRLGKAESKLNKWVPGAKVFNHSKNMSQRLNSVLQEFVNE